jgi:type IV pilus assembly protein PilC
MLLRVADDYDEAVDRSIGAALSLLEPALIIFLAVIVGSIVIALFLPIIGVIIGIDGGAPAGGDGE